MESASFCASDQPVPRTPTVAREGADDPSVIRLPSGGPAPSGPTTAAEYAAWALALHGLIERSQGSAPDWWEDDPAQLVAAPGGDPDEALACLLLLLPLTSLVPSETAAERAGTMLPGPTGTPAADVRALAGRRRRRPCAGPRPAGVRAMPPSLPGQAGWERVRGPVSQAIALVPTPTSCDRFVLGDIARLAAAGPDGIGGGAGLCRERSATAWRRR